MATLLHRLGMLAARRAKTVIAVWFAALVAAVLALAGFGGELTEITLPDTETSRVADRLAEELPDAAGGSATAVVRTRDGEPFTDRQRDRIGSLIEKVEALAPVDEVTQLVSGDGDVALLLIGFHEPLERVSAEQQAQVSATLTGHEVDGADVLPGGDLTPEESHLFSAAEAVGLMIGAVVLLVMLGTFVGAGLPLLNALVGVGIGVSGALAFSGVAEMMSVTPVLGLMLGLAVGIDYALFIVNRHRRQLKGGMPMLESIALANGTAGNAVVFAGGTVIVALLALNVTGLSFLALMGTAAAFSVVVAVLMATTMTPALLRLVGWRILRRRERRRIGTRATPATAEKVTAPIGTRRAVGRAAVAVAVLAVLAVPTFDLRLAFPDSSSASEDSTAFQAYVAIEEAFGQGMNGPLVVVADLPAGLGETAAEDYRLELAERLADHRHVGSVVPIALSEDRTMAAYQVIPVEGPAAESTDDLVHELRGEQVLTGSDVADAELSVAGATAVEIDISRIIADAMPLYLGLVIGLSLMLMILVFRSLLLPLLATLGFVGSLAGALGVVTAVFQWGWFSEITSVGRPGPIMTLLPILVIGILFGLAMDYQLFTASGIREAHAHGAPPRLAVRRGQHAARAVVAAAALIMAGVFAGFVATPDPMIAPIGLGLAVGVLLDAFVVRLILVPAVLTLLGPATWWLPAWLDRMLPDVDVEGSALERTVAAAPVAAGIR